MMQPVLDKEPKWSPVQIIMGSQSDWQTMREAAEVLKELGVDFQVRVVSAHRTPVEMMDFARTLESRGVKAVIAGAGGAAHLPGMVASLTLVPVIGVPVPVGSLQGQDALMSIVQMPKGIPVACMAIGGAANGALMASQILSLEKPDLRARLFEWRERARQSVLKI